VPLQGNANSLSAAILQTKIADYSTYAVTARLPGQRVSEGLWWDTEDPYFYFRIDQDNDGLRIIAGGEDHKTGMVTDTEGCYTRLIQKMHHIFPCALVEKRWSGQVIETADGLPYIGGNQRPVHRHRLLRHRHDFWHFGGNDVP
jgi:glycine/D-amino acid oxidase-like deaminating enzyme